VTPEGNQIVAKEIAALVEENLHRQGGDPGEDQGIDHE
jgi:hypothetical protein